MFPPPQCPVLHPGPCGLIHGHLLREASPGPLPGCTCLRSLLPQAVGRPLCTVLPLPCLCVALCSLWSVPVPRRAASCPSVSLSVCVDSIQLNRCSLSELWSHLAMGPPPPSVCEWTSHSPCPWWPPPDFASCHFRALCLWYRPLLCPCGCRRPLGQGVGWAYCASLSTPLCCQSRSVENAHLTSSLKCPSAFAKTEAAMGLRIPEVSSGHIWWPPHGPCYPSQCSRYRPLLLLSPETPAGPVQPLPACSSRPWDLRAPGLLQPLAERGSGDRVSPLCTTSSMKIRPGHSLLIPSTKDTGRAHTHVPIG